MCWSGSPGTPGMDSVQEAEKRIGKMFNAQSQRMDQIEFDAFKKEVEELKTEVDNTCCLCYFFFIFSCEYVKTVFNYS